MSGLDVSRINTQTEDVLAQNQECLDLLALLADWKEKRARFIKAFLDQESTDKFFELEEAVRKIVEFGGTSPSFRRLQNAITLAGIVEATQGNPGLAE